MKKPIVHLLNAGDLNSIQLADPNEPIAIIRATALGSNALRHLANSTAYQIADEVAATANRDHAVAMDRSLKHRKRQPRPLSPQRQPQKSNCMGELLSAAVAYVLADPANPKEEPPGCWPWLKHCWKPSSDPVRNLVKAGALIAAEIDRLQRLKQNSEPPVELVVAMPKSSFQPSTTK